MLRLIGDDGTETSAPGCGEVLERCVDRSAIADENRQVTAAGRAQYRERRIRPVRHFAQVRIARRIERDQDARGRLAEEELIGADVFAELDGDARGTRA